MRTEKLPQSAERFVPHRPPVLMLRELTSCNGEKAEAIASIPNPSPFCSGERFSRPFLVELLAQLIAAAQGYQASCLGTLPVAGYLVGVHDFDFCKDASEGDSLRLYIRRTNEVEGLLISEGRVMRGIDLLAFGELRCFLVPSSQNSFFNAAALQMEWSSDNSLADIISRSMKINSMNEVEGRIEAEISFATNSPVFTGHFPGRPLVPGVIWFEVGLILARLLFPKHTALQKILSARFKKPIGPEELVRIELEVSPKDSGIRVRSRLSAGKTLTTTFELYLEKA